MKLITELNEEVQIITEGTDNKDYYIQGVFLQSDIVNRNGRIYPKAVMQKEVKRYTETYINSGRALGELEHPEGPKINLDRVSHRIVELKEDGNNYIGKALILDTPMGNLAKSLIKGGTTLGVSSRGLGSLKEQNGHKVVQQDFMLATAADIVADPSAPSAFVEGIMEGIEYNFINGVLVANTMNEIEKISGTVTGLTESKKIEIFTKFINSL